MKGLTIGVQMVAGDARGLVDRIVRAEEAGIDVAWMTSGGVAPDPLAVFAAAAMRTGRIDLGTCIIPTFPRHPLAVAQGAVAVDALAPGRLRLGVGPSHRPSVEATYGLAFERPLQHLREYVTILRAVLQEGAVDFDGKRLHAHARVAGPTGVRVMISALRAAAFRLAGEIADGGISWVSPLAHIRGVAAPAVHAGAEAAGRPAPPIVAHVPVVVSTDVAAVRAATHRQFGFYPRLPFYASMFQDAGFPEAADATFSDAMADALVIAGDEETVAGRIRDIPSFGASEIVASIVHLEDDPTASARTLGLLGELAREDANR